MVSAWRHPRAIVDIRLPLNSRLGIVEALTVANQIEKHRGQKGFGMAAAGTSQTIYCTNAAAAPPPERMKLYCSFVRKAFTAGHSAGWSGRSQIGRTA